PLDGGQAVITLADFVDAQDRISGFDLVQTRLGIGRADVLGLSQISPRPERQQVLVDLLGNAPPPPPERALDELALGDGGIDLNSGFSQEADRNAEDVQDFLAVRLTTFEEIEFVVAEADILPSNFTAAQEGGGALGAAEAFAPFAFDAFEIGIVRRIL